jgi:hypothetical protein
MKNVETKYSVKNVETKNEMIELKLLSTPEIYTPGIVRWAIQLYKTSPKPAINIMKSYGLSESNCKLVLEEKIKCIVNSDESVTISVVSR